MKQITLTQGQVPIVDDENFHRLNRYKWRAEKMHRKNPSGWYAVRSLPRPGTLHKRLAMHHAILLGVSQIDHKDGNGLNNRRANLRRATTRQNNQNQRKQGGLSTKYKGVSWHKFGRKWECYIGINEHRRHLGVFAHEEDAARAYDEAAKRLFGEFARTNFKAV